MTSIFKSKTCEIKKKNKQFELIYEDGEKFENFYNIYCIAIAVSY